MSKLTIVERNWEHLYTQFKFPTGDPVICMVHKQTKKFVFFDTKSNRLLSKQEALLFRPDVTGIHLIHP
jgi:hypothetical protein